MSLYEQLPEWVEFRARLDDRRSLHSELVKASTEADIEYKAEVAAFRKRVEEAVHARKAVPRDDPPPVSASFVHAVQTSQQVLEALAVQGKQVRARLADDVERLAESRYAEIVAEVKDAVAAIESAAKEVSGMLSELASARSAADEVAGITARPSRSARTLSRVTAGELVEYVGAGRSPLKVRGARALGRTDVVTLGQRDYEAAAASGDGGEEMRRLGHLPPASEGRVHQPRGA